MSSDLKTQFLNYMTVQRFSHHTKRSYVTGVKLLAKYYMQSPDTLTNDQIQDYIRYLLEDRKLAWGTCNAYLSGIVCFYRHTYLYKSNILAKFIETAPFFRCFILSVTTTQIKKGRPCILWFAPLNKS